MKVTLYFVLFIMTLTSGFSQSYTFMTYNIRLSTGNDGENAWEHRKEGLVNQIRFHEPDVFGIQEGLPDQVAYFEQNLKDYAYYGVGRDDGKEKGEFSALYFKRDKFKVLKKRTFWLSETPDQPSKGWDAALPRICTTVLLEMKSSGDQFWVFNTHFDHVGKLARKNAVSLILDKIDEYNRRNLPVILMGDLNLTPETEPIQNLFNSMHDSRDVTKNPPFGPIGTWNGFDFNSELSRRIDYIAVSKGNVEVNKYAVLSESKDQKFYSDHLPVYVEVIFSPK